MSTYVLMRILESSPERYDAGIRWLTLGRLPRAYDRLVSHVPPGARVLDIGCGTGALALRAAAHGAHVVGIDVDPAMLEIARRRAEAAGVADRLALRELGVAELDREPAESFDAVMSGLCLSELSDDEIAWALREARRLLRPGGRLLVADEAAPPGWFSRALTALLRAPLVALAWLVTGKTTRPVRDLEARVREAGFVIDEVHRSRLGNFAEVVAHRPDEEDTP